MGFIHTIIDEDYLTGILNEKDYSEEPMEGKREFEDWSEPFEYQYREYEYLKGKEFIHLVDGLYWPRMPFPVTLSQINQLMEEYEDIVFALYMDEKYDQGIDITRSSIFGYIYFAWSKCYARHDAEGFDHCIKLREDWPQVKKCWCSKKLRFMESHSTAVSLPSVLTGSRYRSNSGKFSFALPDENNICLGYPKHIFINGSIGYMFMPGIYYFGNEECPKIRGDIRMDKRTAVMGYENLFSETDEIFVVYLAIDSDHIQTLQNIQKYNKEKFLFHEFPIWEVEKEQDRVVLKVEEGAKELLPGIGMQDIQVGMKCASCSRSSFKKYLYVYKTEEKIVLYEEKENFEIVREEHLLCEVEELWIRKKEELKCGLVMERNQYVIERLSEESEWSELLEGII